jgi:hypothetical protein
MLTFFAGYDIILLFLYADAICFTYARDIYAICCCHRQRYY